MTSGLTEKIAPFLFLIPPFLSVATIIFGIGDTIFLSFTNARLVGGRIDFVGLGNYQRLFADQLFFTSLRNNLIFLAVLGILPLLFGLLIAILLSMRTKGGNVFKALFFFPLILSFVVTGNIWSWMFLENAGLINTFFRSVGLGAIALPWLSEVSLAVPSMGVTGVWQIIGLPIILFSAGLVDIPESLMDASRMDASTFQTYRHIVLPLLKPVFLGITTLLVISAWKVFDLVLIMTYGGPLTGSYVMSFLVFIKALAGYEVGYGSAAATILFVLSLTCIIALVFAGSRSRRRK